VGLLKGMAYNRFAVITLEKARSVWAIRPLNVLIEHLALSRAQDSALRLEGEEETD